MGRCEKAVLEFEGVSIAIVHVCGLEQRWLFWRWHQSETLRETMAFDRQLFQDENFVIRESSTIREND